MVFWRNKRGFFKLCKKAMSDRIDLEKEKLLSYQNFLLFVETRMNEIQLTRPRAIVVEKSPDEVLDELYINLVL